MKKIIAPLILLLAFSLVTSINFAQTCDKSDAHQKSKAVEVTGTIAGAWDYTIDNNAGAWAGYMFLQFGDQPVKMARLIDRSVGEGAEKLTVTFLDGSGSFEILASFTVSEGATPMLLELNEEGTIANGTGDYVNASGSIRIHGPFVAYDSPPSDPYAINPWIASVRGHIRGLAKN